MLRSTADVCIWLHQVLRCQRASSEWATPSTVLHSTTAMPRCGMLQAVSDLLHLSPKTMHNMMSSHVTAGATGLHKPLGRYRHAIIGSTHPPHTPLARSSQSTHPCVRPNPPTHACVANTQKSKSTE